MLLVQSLASLMEPSVHNCFTLPVPFAQRKYTLVGADGATHAGSFDISYLSNLPGFVVMAASDEAELTHMVRTSAEYDEGIKANSVLD